MKRWIAAVFFLFCPSFLIAQNGNTVTIQFNGAPTGSCAFVQLAINKNTGDLYDCFSGSWHLISGGGGGPSAFSAITGGTNNSATMTVGTGSVVNRSGSGVIDASAVGGVTVSGSPAVGQVPIATSGTAAAWGDPIVSGPDAPGVAPTKNPVQIGSFDGTNVQRVSSDSSGKLNVNVSNTPSVAQSGTWTVQQGTPPWSVSQSGSWNVGQSGAPWSQNLTQVNSVALGSPSNYGTSPGAVSVMGVNAFVTNTPSVAQSGTWTVQPGNTANSTAWLVTGTGGTFPATQSGTWTVQPGNTANTTAWLMNVGQFGGTNISTGTGAGGAGIPRVTISNDSSLAANQSVNINQVGAVAVVAQTKGTQATNAFPTQDLKDSGRNRVSFTADRVTPAASDTLVTFTKNVGGTATASQTTYTVTTGKTFRLQAVYFSVVTSTTTVISARLALRENTGGTCTASSSPVLMMEAAGVTAVANEGVSGTNLSMPDGWEFPSADSICFSAIGSTSTGTMTISVIGYEY